MRIRSRKVICSWSLFVGMIVLASGCHKSPREIAEENAIKRHEQEVQEQKNFKPPPSLMQGFNFLIGLANKGQLPGITTNDHGSLRVEKLPDVLPDGRLSQEYHILTSGSPSRSYYYVVAVNTNNSESELLKAWRTEDGKVIEQYRVQQQ